MLQDEYDHVVQHREVQGDKVFQRVWQHQCPPAVAQNVNRYESRSETDCMLQEGYLSSHGIGNEINQQELSSHG